MVKFVPYLCQHNLWVLYDYCLTEKLLTDKLSLLQGDLKAAFREDKGLLSLTKLLLTEEEVSFQQATMYTLSCAVDSCGNFIRDLNTRVNSILNL